MKKLLLITLLLFFLLSGSSTDVKGDEEEKVNLVVHEWGVFHFKLGDVSLSKSEIFAELPKFVLKPKVEKPDFFKPEIPKKPGATKRKPIIYFYADKPTRVSVTVKLTSGKPLCWWPEAKVDNGTFTWDKFIVGETESKAVVKEVDKKNWFNIARQTDASWLTVNKTKEKFLFYEGDESDFDLPLKITGTKSKMKVNLLDKKTLHDVFFINGKKVKYIKKLTAGIIINFEEVNESSNAKDKLQKALKKAGLKTKEASGIVKIWDKEFFQNKGIRIIYRITKKAYDKLLPIKIVPKPIELVRVGLVFVEDIDPELHTRIDGLINDLKEKKHLDLEESPINVLTKIGRPALAAVTRLMNETNDPEIKTYAARIIKRIKTPLRIKRLLPE